MITIIHPSRSRPDQSLATCKKWLQRAGVTEIELIVSLDIDEPYRIQYERHRGLHAVDSPIVKGGIIFNNNRSAIDAINNAAARSRGDILIVVSDDTDCPENWGRHIEGLTYGMKDWIMKTQDGIQPWIITMPIMDREYYNRFGYIYHPDYIHMWCDTELTCVSELTGRKIVSSLIFKHNHYSIEKGRKLPDVVSQKANISFNSGRDLFITRKEKYFDLPVDKIVQSLPYNYYTSLK
jgi:hypothetical protein